MDPPGSGMNDAGVYNFSEIWKVFQVGPSSTPYGYAVEPMATERQKFTHNQIASGTEKSRKQRDGDEPARVRTSTSNSVPPNNSSMSEGDAKRLKPLETSRETCNNEEPPRQDYIHVRARRGQATDSHSLAERARREKISERMRILQDLVPGCNKVIGKALVLDEIINYIQSLQRQVEFLSMKLEAVNARIGLDGYSPKSFTQQIYEAPSVAYGSQRVSSPDWLHMQIGGGCERNSWQILPSTPEK